MNLYIESSRKIFILFVFRHSKFRHSHYTSIGIVVSNEYIDVDDIDIVFYCVNFVLSEDV